MNNVKIRIPTKKPRALDVYLALRGRKGGKMRDKRKEALRRSDPRLQEY